MGGCHSYPSATKTESKTPCDISNDKPGINNNNQEERPYLQEPYVRHRITDSDMLALTALPPGVDRAEWLASNTVAFFKHINLLSSALSEFCTTSTCPTACGPGNTIYFWTDEHGRKLKCSAPLYFDYALSYIQELLTDEDVFPTKAGAAFPTGFFLLVQKVFLLLFRTLAHIYWSHYNEALALGLHPHLNTMFAHLTLFCQHHALLESEDTEPLQPLITALRRQR
ncbi:MOB kinase activator 2 [Oryzias melastigma]|uniref:MOB kinase activator 2 n=1 Tax=Oryzias melastigma TaxID=30732 RepID=A0A3B3D604_ORYME|nr:MOB kinase activator 2 [Oryzias melastigma]KAF6735045.1 MOB kinase activator 2 [Oryzias melastigma]